MLVLGLITVLAFFILPNFRDPLRRSALPESGRRLRSLIGMTRANAMLDGLRYRIRFLQEDDEAGEMLSLHDMLQPFVEVEREPIEYPGEYTPVKASWATQQIFLGAVWCYETRIGEPTYEDVIAELEGHDEPLDDERQRKRELGLEEDDPWVVVFEPGGTSEWMTFRLVAAPYDTFHEDDLETVPQLDVILDGRLGQVFLQRPLREEEIEVLLEKGHSPILRRDFLVKRSLTEDDVLEIDMRRKR